MRLLTLLMLVPALLSAGDWSRFRGPNGAGVAEESPLPDRIGPETNVVWKTDLPMGKSSPTLTKDRIFLTGHEDDRLVTIGLDRATGKILWKREAPSRRLEKMHQLNDESSSSPVTDGSNVYVFFGGYGLLSYTADGDERWRRPLGPFTNFHGMGASPLYHDGKVLMVCDQDQGAYIIAVDAATGETVWRVERPDMVHSFSTPALYEPEDGPTELIVARLLPDDLLRRR
jgi:outer membrane protein assembly factor BamB